MDAEGKTYTINYVADENGYRAQGDHLPVAPEAAAVPEVKCPWPSFPKSTLFFQLRLTTCLWFAQLCLWPLLLPSVTAITLLIPTITAMLTPSTDSHSSIRISSYSYTQL